MVRNAIGVGLLGLSGVYLLRGYSFIKENDAGEFVAHILAGLTGTLFTAWDHPAFGLCCMMPTLFVIFLGFAYTTDSEE